MQDGNEARRPLARSPSRDVDLRVPPSVSVHHALSLDDHFRPDASRRRSNAWAIPWSDLMMVMFILFVVLFVTQAADRELGDAFRAEAPSGQREPDADSQLPPSSRGTAEASGPGISLFEQSFAAMRSAGLPAGDVLLQPDRSIRVRLGGPVFFELGSAELRPGARAALDRLARVIAHTSGRIRVVGHTDDYPIHSETFPTNWELSAGRAAAVARHLIRSGGLDPARFSIVGRSMYAPARVDDSVRGKARNRRVEIVIDPQEPLGSGARS